MSVSYRFNLIREGVRETSYTSIGQRALSAAKAASAVDSGAFKRGWKVRQVGDFLFVYNQTRYAAPVELGSAVHKKHQYEIRDALARIGLRSPQISVGAGTYTESRSNSSSKVKPLQTALSSSEIRSPALLLKRSNQSKVSLSNLFKISFLTSLLGQSNQGEPNEQSQ